MAAIPLSNGETLTVPDDATDEQAQQYYDQAEAAIRAESDTGAALPVEEDQPGWDWLRNNAPGLFTGGREIVGGIAEGVGNLPNAIPNVVNKVNDLYHLHTDEEGAPPPTPVMDQWMTGSGFNDKSLAEMNPAEPGWEKYRDYGRMTGAALPAGPTAAVVIPALSKLGSGAGAIADYFYGDPSIHDQTIQDYMLGDAPQGKWSQTGEFVAPLATGLAVKGARGVSNSPRLQYLKSDIGNVASKAVGPIAGLATLMKTGSLPAAWVAAKAAPGTLRGLGKAASFVAPAFKPIADAVTTPGLGGVFARAASSANEEQQRQRLFGGPR